MEINFDDLAQQCIDAIADSIKNLNNLNIIVVGKSGVGKSTLINSVFRENLAETGLGRPVTANVRKIQKKGFPLTVYDTPGFELSKEQQTSVKDQILSLIYEGNKTNDINDSIHCIWYCINVGGNRTFDESELAWLKALTESNKTTQVPIIVVLTQSVPKRKAQELKTLVENENLDIVKVVPVLAQDMNFDDEYLALSYGLDRLIDVMAESLPDELQNTLQNAQKANLESKKKHSQAVVASAVTAAFGEGFAPIPFADAALLIPTQVSMIAGITTIFGLELSKSILTAFISSTLGAGGATLVGKTMVSELLKLIPGAGSVTGGAISGATAGLLTTALGEAYIKIMELVFTGKLSPNALTTKKGKEQMKTIFKDELRHKHY